MKNHASPNLMASVGTPLADVSSQHPTRRKALHMGTALAVTTLLSGGAAALEKGRDRLAQIRDERLAGASSDTRLMELCQRCLAALARWQAIFDEYPTKGLDFEAARLIEHQCDEAVSGFYEAHVEPLMNEIQNTPATTLAGFAAKARVFIADSVEVIGTESAEAACAQMLEDLANIA